MSQALRNAPRTRLVVYRPSLSAIINAEPGETLIPHLYDWWFTDLSTYVSTDRYIGESRTELTVELSLRFLVILSDWLSIIRRANEHSYGWRIYQEIFRPMAVFAYQGSDGVKRWILSSGVLNVGEWYDITVTFSVQAGRAVMYINGGAVMTSVGVYEIGGNQQPIIVGGGARAVIGYARVYNRSLSNTEVLQAHSSRIINASDLVLFLDATFYNGTYYIDLSGNGNHVYPYNNPLRVPAERCFLWRVKGGGSKAKVLIPPMCRFFVDGSWSTNSSWSFIEITVDPGVHHLAFEGLEVPPVRPAHYTKSL